LGHVRNRTARLRGSRGLTGRHPMSIAPLWQPFRATARYRRRSILPTNMLNGGGWLSGNLYCVHRKPGGAKPGLTASSWFRRKSSSYRKGRAHCLACGTARRRIRAWGLLRFCLAIKMVKGSADFDPGASGSCAAYPALQRCPSSFAENSPCPQQTINQFTIL
jgi:hypothetical protein